MKPPRRLYYGLDGHTPVPCDMFEANTLLCDADARIVGADEIPPVFVSTVFLVIDHSFVDGPPVLFETIVFRGTRAALGEVLEEERYTTWEKAELGHAAWVVLAKEHHWGPAT